MAGLFDLDLLNALVVIAETGSLSAAAPRLCRSQSAVSEQVRKLEETCGSKLLLRGKTGARLTPAGERLAAHAVGLLAMSRAAYRDIQGVQLTGDLRLAITDYFRPRALPGILRRVRDQFPSLRLHVSILRSAAIEEEVKAGDFDIGLSMTILEREHAKAGTADQGVTLRREPLAWVADKAFVMPENGVLPLVVLPETCSLRRLIIKALDAQGAPYTIAHSASGVGGLHLALAAGLGVTCLNASAIPEGAVAIAGAPRLAAMPEVEFSLVRARAGEAPVLAEVRDMLAEQFG
jgi:DNA-binding transcriptional LysR family regulator